MLITQLLSQAEAEYGSLYYLLARKFKAIPNTQKTAALLNNIFPSPVYYIAHTRDVDRQNLMSKATADWSRRYT